MADAAAFDGFYQENLARIVRACLLVTLDRATAEDVAAEAFARLWSHWGAIGSENHAGGYVFKTAMRSCAKEVRRRARHAPVAGAQVDEIAGAITRQDLGRALATLSVRQRQGRAPGLGGLRDCGGRTDARNEGKHRPGPARSCARAAAVATDRS
jgi:DNA-directed RNA polymerase specialized sigma24 family protein